MTDILQAIHDLRRELGDTSTEVSSTPVADWAELLLRLALCRGARTLHLLPHNENLRILLDDTELPAVPWTGPALSRLLVLCGLQKGEAARAKRQTADSVVTLEGRPVALTSRTVPLGPFREEIHIDLRPL